MTHHSRQVIMSFYDVPSDKLEMVHQLFSHLSEVTQGSCNFNVFDPTVGNEERLPVYLDDAYVGEATIDDEGDISMSVGRGTAGMILRNAVLSNDVDRLVIKPKRGVFDA